MENIRQNKKKSDWLDISVWIFTALAFSPFALWLIKEVSQSRQLSDALVILAAMCIVLALDNRIKLHRPQFKQSVIATLAAAYAAFALAHFCGAFAMPVALLGFALFVASIALACFDIPRYALALGVAFYAFLLLSLFITAFDLPLRVLAGEFSVWILKFINPSAMLVTLANQPPQIGMVLGGKTYLVATECNGFGLISSCTVLSVLFASFARNVSILKRLSTILICIFVAILANALRIAAIVLIAPHFSDKYYMPIHEACGYFFFALALLAVWKISKDVQKKA